MQYPDRRSTTTEATAAEGRVAILLHVLAAALYGLAAWARWPGTQPATGVAARAGSALLPAAIAVHAYATASTVVTPEGLDLSLTNALSLVAGLCVLVAWGSGLFRALPGIAAVVLPVAAVGSLLPALAESPHRFPFATEPWAAAHIAVALLGYALLMVAALQALLLTGLEKRLHRGLPMAGEQATPPLLTLERYLFRLILAGFVLLTLTVGSGVLFSALPVLVVQGGITLLAAQLAFLSQPAVLDAVNAAGGLLPGAEVSGLNLAQRLRDGMQIHVPGRPVIKDEGSSPQYQPVAGAARNSSPPAGAPVPAAKVNINTATAAELDQLPGIGPAMAARIVEWRQANGPFQSGEDLKKVQGIGEAKYRKLKDKITW